MSSHKVKSKSTPSSINSILNRIHNFRSRLETSFGSISSDSQHSDPDTHSPIQSLKPINITVNNNNDSKSQKSAKVRDKNYLEIPLTPKLSSPSTISSTHVLQYESTHKKPQKPQSNNSNNSNMSISSPSTFENVFEKLQSFRVSLDTSNPTKDNTHERKYDIQSLNASIPSLLQPNVTNNNNTKTTNLSFESQIIANIPSQSQDKSERENKEFEMKQTFNESTLSSSTRQSQILDLKQFLSLPSPAPKGNINGIKEQMLPFRNRYKSEMKNILNRSGNSHRTNPHYYYTSPSVVSDATIPSHLLTQFPNNRNSSQSLQDAYERHRQSIDLNKLRKKKGNRKPLSKAKKPKNKKKTSVKHVHNDLCQCSCHLQQRSSPTPLYPLSYDGDIEEEEKKESVRLVPVIESNIGKTKTHPMSPPIAVGVKRVKKGKNKYYKLSDLDSERILNENKESSLCMRGGIIQDLVRLSSISPSPIWHNNRHKLHIKEIRKFGREYQIISSVATALWTKYDLEILKLYKLTWSQRIMAFAEPSVMFYIIGKSAKNTPKQLFDIAEHRFNGLEYIELKYRLNSDKHKFALMCIVDSYYIINETDQYFIDQKHCIPSYLIRNKKSSQT